MRGFGWNPIGRLWQLIAALRGNWGERFTETMDRREGIFIFIRRNHMSLAVHRSHEMNMSLKGGKQWESSREKSICLPLTKILRR